MTLEGVEVIEMSLFHASHILMHDIRVLSCMPRAWGADALRLIQYEYLAGEKSDRECMKLEREREYSSTALESQVSVV